MKAPALWVCDQYVALNRLMALLGWLKEPERDEAAEQLSDEKSVHVDLDRLVSSIESFVDGSTLFR